MNAVFSTVVWLIFVSIEDSWGLLTWFNLIPACLSYYMPGKMWDEITYPFLNLNGCTVEIKDV